LLDTLIASSSSIAFHFKEKEIGKEGQHHV
jgi:hypothetical protein